MVIPRGNGRTEGAGCSTDPAALLFGGGGRECQGAIVGAGWGFRVLRLRFRDQPRRTLDLVTISAKRKKGGQGVAIAAKRAMDECRNLGEKSWEGSCRRLK